MLMTAVVSVTLALILYTLGIWVPRPHRNLKTWHVAVLWLGFLADSLGTVFMSILAGGWKPTLHGWTGLVANVLMVAVALWATVVWRGDRASTSTGQATVAQAYRLGSRVVWFLWLVPMVLGMAFRGRV